MTKNAAPSRSRVLSALIAVAMLMGLCTTSVRGQDEAAMRAFMQNLTPAYVKSMTGKHEPTNDDLKGIMKDRGKANKYLKEHEPNDNKLKYLLLQTFEADWAKAKQCLLFNDWPVDGAKPPHKESLTLMGELVKMRSRECKRIAFATQDATLQYLKENQFPTIENYLARWGLEKNFDLELEKYSDAQAQFNMLAPTGAEKRTSDIDVASNGLNTEIGVRLFNKTFREKLKVQWDPATVFDYNVYAADWIFPSGFVKKVNGSQTELTPMPEHVLHRDCGAVAAKDIELQVERAKILEKAGLLHIRRNCTEKGWNLFITSRTHEGPAIVTLLQVVDNQYKTFEAEITSRRAKVEQSITKNGKRWGSKNDHYFHEAVDTLARNQLYQDKLLRVKALRLHYRVLKDKSRKTDKDRQQMFTLAKQITEALGEALYFANEVYATEGATLHATQAIQAVAKAKADGHKLRVVLSADHYKQSFLENVGDSLHSLKHYKDDPPYAKYRAGKYIERMILAGREILGEEKKEELLGHPNFAQLNELSIKAAKIKASSVAGDDPVIIKMNFKSANAKDTEKLIHAILDVGAHVAGQAGH